MRKLFLSLALSALAWTLSAAEPTAWDELMKTHPDRLERLAPAEREALRSMSPRDLQRLGAGAMPEQITLFSGESLSVYLERTGGQTFDMSWHSSDNGAARLTGGTLTLTGSFGQAEVGRLAGGDFALEGGFATRSWAEIENILFNDGFESGNTMRWSLVVP